MKYAAIASFTLMTCVASQAQATQVYPGCNAPVIKAGHRTFYVDPNKGAAGGDGSAAKPWRTLAEVISSGKVSTMGHKVAGGTDPLVAMNPSGPIKPGDVIMLMNGNHGSVTLSNAFNSDYVTVMAGPGQTPIVSDLTVISASKWMFQGVKFQSAENPISTDVSKRSASRLAWVSRSDYFGASTDFVFDNDTFSSTDDTSSWTDNDYLVRTKEYGLAISATCTAVTNSDFYNLVNGILIIDKNVLIQNNTIRRFSNDGIEFAASNVTIRGNTIKDTKGVVSSGWHTDGMQGWSLTTNGKVNTNSNVLIENNTITKAGDPAKTALQGISIYDGKWDNLTVQNNAVAVNLWNAISVNGVSNSRIVNNTVVATEPVSHKSWIAVGTSHAGVASSNVVLRNNISPSITVTGAGITYDHNVVAGMYTVVSSGKATYKNASDPTKSIILLPSLTSQFVGVNNDTGVYDLRLKPASSLIGTGSPDMMPSADIQQRSRKSPVSPGAYAQ